MATDQMIAFLSTLLLGIVIGFVCAFTLVFLGGLLVLSGRKSREEGE